MKCPKCKNEAIIITSQIVKNDKDEPFRMQTYKCNNGNCALCGQTIGEKRVRIIEE